MHKGCACKFLYGADTEDDKKQKIEKSLEDKIELKLEIKFYKKNGKLNRYRSSVFMAGGG